MTSFHRIEVDVARVAVPTLVLYGEDEVHPAARQALAEGVPRARVRAVPDAGHVSSLAPPELLCRDVRDFVTSLLTRAVAPA